MSEDILTQAFELRNVARQAELWITEPNAKGWATLIADRADRLLADLRRVCPAAEVEPISGT